MLKRITAFEKLFYDLQHTSSRLDKECMIYTFKRVHPEYIEDLHHILETLDNRHPIGWTFTPSTYFFVGRFESIKEMLQYLEAYKEENSLSREAVSIAEDVVGVYGEFIEPIVNRTLKLGIGKSLLPKNKLSPMLAKKYSGQRLGAVTVTEKLDGNRCIAYYENGKWKFVSRSGKSLAVDFDMSILPKDIVYDGEILSSEQTVRSIERCKNIFNTSVSKRNDEQLLFNETSGLINSKSISKNLVYNMFDIIVDDKYEERRKFLDSVKISQNDLRILPTLYNGSDQDTINALLDNMCRMGGEGIMLNLQGRNYENKRTEALLKYKQVQYCDMLVSGVFEGKGKYEGLCGGLECCLITEDGKHIECDVGTGLSDLQREEWGLDCNEIIGKIVQIGYHEMTQDKSNIGTNSYSLRFPRLIKVRTDKTITSEF